MEKTKSELTETFKSKKHPKYNAINNYCQDSQYYYGHLKMILCDFPNSKPLIPKGLDEFAKKLYIQSYEYEKQRKILMKKLYSSKE